MVDCKRVYLYKSIFCFSFVASHTSNNFKQQNEEHKKIIKVFSEEIIFEQFDSINIFTEIKVCKKLSTRPQYESEMVN